MKGSNTRTTATLRQVQTSQGGSGGPSGRGFQHRSFQLEMNDEIRSEGDRFEENVSLNENLFKVFKLSSFYLNAVFISTKGRPLNLPGVFAREGIAQIQKIRAF